MSRSKDKPTPLTDGEILSILRNTILLFKERVEEKAVAISSGDLIRLLEMESPDRSPQRNQVQLVV